MEILPPELCHLIKTFLPSFHINQKCPSRPIFFNHTGPWCAHCGGRTNLPFRYPPYTERISRLGGPIPAFLKKCPVCDTLMFLRDAFCVQCGDFFSFTRVRASN